MDGEKRAHSVKVPRLYKVAGHLLQEHEAGRGSVKDLVYNNKKHPNVKAVFALVSESARRKDVLDKVLRGTRLLEKETGLNEHLARILITELIWGKGGLAGRSRPVMTVAAYQDRIQALLSAAEAEKKAVVRRPRFVRINRLKADPRRVTATLIEQGFRRASYRGGYRDFTDRARALREDEFMEDYHLADVLVFHPRAEFFDNALYQKGQLVLQDKASCLTVAALNPPPGCSLLDACAAPGMKTIQAAAAVSDPAASSPQVIAVERSRKRFKNLINTLGKHGADKMVAAKNEDFLSLRPSSFPHVEYIVLDPSCSGSGILRESGTDVSRERIEKLSSLQTKLLRHALAFPGVQRIAYSTCSTQREENEDVVLKVLDDSQVSNRFKLVMDVLPTWENRGVAGVPHENAFIRSNPDVDLCNGFFVAVLEKLSS